MQSLEAALESARAVDPRFTTVRATIRDWSHFRRIAEIQSLGWSGDEEEEEGEERLTLLWIDGTGRAREELDSGWVLQRRELEEVGNWPLFDPSWLFDANPAPVGEREVAGRAGIVVQADKAAGFLLPYSNRCTAVVDRERGLVLSAEASLDDELLMVEELVEIAFDEPFDPAIFKGEKRPEPRL
jgi:hypothetical protein